MQSAYCLPTRWQAQRIALKFFFNSKLMIRRSKPFIPLWNLIITLKKKGHGRPFKPERSDSFILTL